MFLKRVGKRNKKVFWLGAMFYIQIWIGTVIPNWEVWYLNWCLLCNRQGTCRNLIITRGGSLIQGRVLFWLNNKCRIIFNFVTFISFKQKYYLMETKIVQNIYLILISNFTIIKIWYKVKMRIEFLTNNYSLFVVMIRARLLSSNCSFSMQNFTFQCLDKRWSQNISTLGARLFFRTYLWSNQWSIRSPYLYSSWALENIPFGFSWGTVLFFVIRFILSSEEWQTHYKPLV